MGVPPSEKAGGGGLKLQMIRQVPWEPSMNEVGVHQAPVGIESLRVGRVFMGQQ